MMAITEIAPDVYQIVTYVPEADLQFNQFLIKDDEPLLFHTGMNALFPVVHEAVAGLIDPATLRWISFSHFEADECGSLNQWLQIAPNAQTACSLVGAMVSVNDFALRPARGLTTDEVINTGKYRFRFLHTPHVPHCWEAGMLFEETNGTLLCSDLFHQSGVVEPLTTSDVIERARKTLVDYQAGPLANYMPYTKNTDAILQSLAELKPRTIAPMHGSAYVGDGERAIRDFAVMMREVLG
ncbi:MAG TPA: MBL fold metallo-hydrolase [Blastocatellia bacterium]|nr:MBL fold metallo-hydrolase [Blastocatellia bacterium]HMV84877.1 MBL fold metallo-hydrolase [Blastocatellia bacterium]HMX29273.1 MBL fold metallo-hydrolase [Blastocatellia bacterium]HMY73503.1 MBL fold metallo-hydrolase [Blastocatellia bacterium]HMZ21034.1 MBL fold metallo-hydrolase [Blastocatellia bacterium]